MGKMVGRVALFQSDVTNHSLKSFRPRVVPRAQVETYSPTDTIISESRTALFLKAAEFVRDCSESRGWLVLSIVIHGSDLQRNRK